MSVPSQSPALEWRNATQDNLRAAGPTAIAIMRGECTEVDELVLATALSSAGLLDEVTIGDRDLSTLHAEIYVVASQESIRVDSLLTGLELEVHFMAQPDKNDALHKLVALAGLVHVLPQDSDGFRRASEALAYEKEAIEEEGPSQITSELEELSAAAKVISTALNLSTDHPALAILALFIKK